MKFNQIRFKSAFKAMGVHFGFSLVVSLLVAGLVFLVWYPYPYREMAGGRELFFLVLGVDLICGPLLTFVLYSPIKPKRELLTDLLVVVALQLIALVYGVWTVWAARPLFMVHEFDRFKVIASVDVDASEISNLPHELKPHFFSSPVVVSLRDVTKEEREKVMFESIQGGKDYGEHPNFYAKYDGIKAYQKSTPMIEFQKKHPTERINILKLVDDDTVGKTPLRYLPIIARQDWIAVLNPNGQIIGYLKGDGF